MKNKMAAATGFWNRRGILAVCPTGSQKNACKEIVDTEVVVDTINRISALHRKLKLPQLWSEVAIIKALVYKYGNQHKKEKYFQGLKKVVKCLNRLQEIGIYDKVADLKNKFPRLSKCGVFITETLSNYPSTGLIISILGYLTGAAQLLLQVISSCQETFKYSCAQMVCGYFLTFHLTCSSSLSRIWVLVRSFLQDVAECYDIIFPWLNHLSDPQLVNIETSKAKDLPGSLKEWLESLEGIHPNNNSKSQTPPVKALTPGTLDKLFASTPRQKPEDSSPRLFTSEAESLVEPPFDFGETFIPDEVNRSLKDSEAFTSDENVILRRKLFTENTENSANLPKQSEERFTTSAVANTENRTAELRPPRTPTKKRKTDVKTCFKNRPVRFSSRKKIHVYSNKRWKLRLEKARRKKLAKSLAKTSKRQAGNIADTRTTEESFMTRSKGEIQCERSEPSGRPVFDRSENSTKSSKPSNSCNLGNFLSLSDQTKAKAADRKRKAPPGEDFVQRENSSLFGKFKRNSLNSDSYIKVESFETQRLKESFEHAEFEDEIDSIFNALND